VTSEQYEAALARAAAIARRVSAWIMFDNPHPDLLERAHAALLDEFAADPLGIPTPSAIEQLIAEHEAQRDACCAAESAAGEASRRVAEVTRRLDEALASVSPAAGGS